MATLTDNLRDRWEGISTRERRLVVLLLVTLPATLLIYLGLQIRDGLGAIEARNAKTRRALAVVADLRSRGAPAPVSADATAAIPKTPIDLPIYLNAAAEKIGVTIPSFNRQPEVARDGFVIQRVRISLKDLTLTQATDLLAAIEDNRAVAVTELAFKRNFRDAEKLDLDLDVSAFAHAPAPGEADAAGSGSAGSGS